MIFLSEFRPTTTRRLSLMAIPLSWRRVEQLNYPHVRLICLPRLSV